MYNNNPNQLYNSNMHASRSAVDTLLKDLGAEPLFSSINDPPPAHNAIGPKSFLRSICIFNSSQIFGQGIQQQQNQNSNQSNQVGLPNPISILNEMHQRNRGSGVPPKYSFTMDANTGNFYCHLEVFGKVFSTERPTIRKQQAKEEAALMAIRSLVNGNNSSDGNRNVIGSDIMKLYEPSFSNYPENRPDIVCKSESWYRKQLNDCPGKQSRVILLEFCQMHRLPTPQYQAFNDYNGNTYFECIVGDRFFKSDKSFVKSNDAKDYVARIAFDALYREMCEKERRNNVGQVDTKSILNFLENHVTSNPSSNINSPLSNISSPLSNISSPLSNISNPHSHLNSSNSHMNSLHPDVKLNNIGSSHLNVTNTYSNFSSPSPNPPHLTNSGVTSPHNPQLGVTSSHLNIGSLHTGVNNLHSGMNNPNSSVTNSYSSVTNSHSLYSSVTSPHNPHSSVTNPHLNMSSPHSNVTNSHLIMGNSHSNVDGSLATNITNPHSHLNSISNPHTNTHLNEITTSLVLPNFSHEVSNIKVEETIPLSPQNMDTPIIKTEESNMRDQLQSNPASSSISYHPYRTVGRERFPQNPSYTTSNQFAKKNTGFCKKFTSLLYEMSQSKRWTPPEFNYENGINGFICVCSVQDYLFKGKACSRKADAKESAAEEAYRFLTRIQRG
ncbi:sporulation-specific protein 15-like [Rhizophagus clarus]|uniref:Sporulation-specific protein 15-like n=1 Tax=Rhizophagus clarus TaxID=94130 RepID=A0A8H3R5L7_9GLOM|nr:sporulation-specific protein 15-like [Rhizophagus clarus]